MESEVLPDSIRRRDPSALRVAMEDRGRYYFAKRVCDLIGPLLLLILLSPLMLLTGILISLCSPGPVFFVQERVGSKRERYHGRSYWKRTNVRCYKFRTMKANADASIHKAYVKALIENDQAQMDTIQGATVPIRRLVDDQKIIRLGWLLRKLSLDELPQVWNAVRGDMSPVGPRPAIPYEVELYQLWHLRRLEAQPGLTGLQQVTARCTADFDQQVQFDLEYIENQSLWLDLKIILRTPLAVISTKGAQ